MSKTDQILAIVVPAYRAAYLAAALKSILSQTDQRFKLYVFDDASTDPIAEMVSEFGSRRPISFHRFQNNLGGTSLVAHWKRCIENTNEPWVWVFSDDDLMDSTCVASFLNELNNSNGKHDLYRFNTRSIDAEDRLISESKPHPILETGSDFLCARLQDKRTSTMQELTFSRAAYAKLGGIPDFPLAWSSDDAFISSMGVQRPIKTIAGPRVSWRQSGLNISTNFSLSNAKRKIMASQIMVGWANDFLLKHPPTCGPLSSADLESMTSIWFFRRVRYNDVLLDLRAILQIDKFASITWKWPRSKGLIKCFGINYALLRRRLLGRIKSLFVSLGITNL
jgi:glycosyltransferase involved in cell wall biosynthesis